MPPRRGSSTRCPRLPASDGTTATDPRPRPTLRPSGTATGTRLLPRPPRRRNRARGDRRDPRRRVAARGVPAGRPAVGTDVSNAPTGLAAVSPSAASPAATPSGAAATPSAPAASPSSSTSSGPSTEPSPSPSQPDPVLVGVGDIATCDHDDDEQTAALVARLEGIVFTLGDNAYDRGSAAEFRDCYDPSWGRVKDRTEFPVAGNHDWDTRNAAGYREYFGKRATPNGDDLVLARRRGMARDRARRQLHGARGWLPAGISPAALAAPGPRRERRDVHARDVAPAAVQQRRAWQRHVRRPVLGRALRRAGPTSSSTATTTTSSASPHRTRTATATTRAASSRSSRGRAAARCARWRTRSRTRSCARAGSSACSSVTLRPTGWDSRFIPTDDYTFTDESHGTCH